MKTIRFALPLLMLLLLGFALAGCPKSDKMMQNTPAPSPTMQQYPG